MRGEEFPVGGGVRESDLVFAQVRTVDEVIPEALDHTRGDAQASHHADHPDATDAADGWFWCRGAAPSSLSLEHHLLPL